MRVSLPCTITFQKIMSACVWRGGVGYKATSLNKICIIIISCRLESLFRFVHNGIPVLSHAESKMKKELEDIETSLQFHREALEQVQRVS